MRGTKLAILFLVVLPVFAGCVPTEQDGSGPQPKAGLKFSWQVLMVTLSVDTNGEVSIDFDSPSLVTPLGRFSVGMVVDPASFFEDEGVKKVLIVRFNGQEEYFDLGGNDVEVHFASAYYEALTITTRDGNVLVDIRSSQGASGYTVSGAAPPKVAEWAGTGGGALRLAIGQRATIFTTAGSTLNMRESPGTDARIVNRLHSGLVVIVLNGPAFGDGYTWWEIESPDGPRGWVAEWIDGYQMLLPGVPPTPSAPPQVSGPTCGGKVARFSIGETVVVSLRGDDLRILRSYNDPLSGLAMAVTDDRLRIEQGPACSYSPRYQQDVIYWYVYSYTDNVYGWVADGITNEQWLCPLSNPACDR